MLPPPGESAGAVETSRLQKRRNQAVRQLRTEANRVDPLANVRERVTRLPTAAAPAPLIDVLLSPEAERFAGARIAADAKRDEQPTAGQQIGRASGRKRVVRYV